MASDRPTDKDLQEKTNVLKEVSILEIGLRE